MKKAIRPAGATKPAQKGSAIKQSAAKSKVKPSSKPKRKAQGQAELLPIIERLAHAAERLAQAAERLTDATTGGPAARVHEATTRENPAPDTVL
jgi:hypothetical protein